MLSGRLMEKYLLKSPGERPFRGSLRNFLYALGTTFAVLGILLIIERPLDWKYFLGILLITNGLFFFGWGSERLWYATISKMVENPFSFKAYISRVPFWFVGGGVAFSSICLFAYKWGLIYISSVSQYHLFVWGGILECLIQIPLQVILYRSLIKKVKMI